MVRCFMLLLPLGLVSALQMFGRTAPLGRVLTTRASTLNSPARSFATATAKSGSRFLPGKKTAGALALGGLMYATADRTKEIEEQQKEDDLLLRVVAGSPNLSLGAGDQCKANGNPRLSDILALGNELRYLTQKKRRSNFQTEGDLRRERQLVNYFEGQMQNFSASRHLSKQQDEERKKISKILGNVNCDKDGRTVFWFVKMNDGAGIRKMSSDTFVRLFAKGEIPDTLDNLALHAICTRKVAEENLACDKQRRQNVMKM